MNCDAAGVANAANKARVNVNNNGGTSHTSKWNNKLNFKPKINVRNVGSGRKETEVYDDSYTNYPAIDKRDTYLQLKMSANNFALMSFYKPLNGPLITTFRRYAIHEFLNSVRSLLSMKVMLDDGKWTNATESALIVLERTESEVILKQFAENSELSLSDVLLMSNDNMPKIMNPKSVIEQWLRVNCTDNYDLPLYLTIYEWMVRFVKNLRLVPCYKHAIEDFEDVTLAEYGSTNFLPGNFTYPSQSLTINNEIKNCTCAGNIWILITKLFNWDDPLVYKGDNKYIFRMCSENIQLHTKRAEKMAHLSEMPIRLQGALECEFYMKQKLVINDNVPYVDASQTKTTGIDLGLAVKACSEEVTHALNEIGLVCVIKSVSHGTNTKSSLAICVKESDGTVPSDAHLREIMYYIFPLYKFTMNTCGVYDVALSINVGRRKSLIPLGLMRRALMPIALNRMIKSSYVINTHVNASIIIDVRAWCVDTNGSIKYVQDLGAGYGLALAYTIVAGLKGYVNIKPDAIAANSIINSELRLFVNIGELAGCKVDDLHAKLSDSLQAILNDSSKTFFIEAIASTLSSIRSNTVNVGTIDPVKHYFAAVVKSKRIAVPKAATNSNPVNVQDTYILPVKCIDMSSDVIKGHLLNRIIPSADGITYEMFGMDNECDLTDQVGKSLKQSLAT